MPGHVAERARPGARAATRVALLLVAVFAVAWFALIARSLHEQASIRADLHSHPVVSRALAVTLDRRVDQAAVLNPDRQIPMLKALIDFSAREPAAAVTIARRITREEPDNIDNWVTLEILLNGRDPALVSEARAHIRALAPPVPAAP